MRRILKNSGNDKDSDSKMESDQADKKNSEHPGIDEMTSSETKLRYGSGEARLLDWGLFE